MSRRTGLIVAILVLSMGVGAFEAYLEWHQADLRVASAASMFPFAVLLFTWCKADASHRGMAPPPGAALLVGIFAVIGIPYYFFHILPPVRAAICSVYALAILAFSMVLTRVAFVAALRAYAS